MKRRDALLCCATLMAVCPRLVAADSTRPPRVALVFNDTPLADMLGPEPASPYVSAFIRALRERGYIEGQNFIIEQHSAEGKPDRMPTIMRDVAASKVDVIVTTGRGAVAALQATKSIPVVTISDDPVAIGLVDTLREPNRNLTGVSTTAGPDIEGKRLELLKELSSSLSRVAVIDFKYVNPVSTPGTHSRRLAVQSSAKALALDITFVGVDTVRDLGPAFSEIVSAHAQAVLVTGNSVNQVNLTRIIDFARRERLLTIGDARAFPAAGGLMSYGPSAISSWRIVAEYVDRLLKGARPSDLPYQQPRRYELAINLVTAQALGIRVPQSLVLRADELFQ